MELIRAVILEVRQHATHPIKVDVDLEDGLELDWLTCPIAVWAAVNPEKLEGCECIVLDTQFFGDANRFRILEIYPSKGYALPGNTKALVRRGDAVSITGHVNLTGVDMTKAASSPAGPLIPLLGSNLGHALKGRVTE